MDYKVNGENLSSEHNIIKIKCESSEDDAKINNNINLENKNMEGPNKSIPHEKNQATLLDKPVNSNPKKRNKKKKKKRPTFQKAGTPGGFDDPLRKGLSGAGVKWYLRFLKKGLAPEEARIKALERKTQWNTPLRQNNLQGKRKRYDMSSAKKEDIKALKLEGYCEGNRPITALTIMKLSEKFSISDDYKTLPKENSIAVFPTKYPQSKLTASELKALEDAIIEEVTHASGTFKIQFEGRYFKSGMLIINCANFWSAEWLLKIIPKLRSWKGEDLMACPGDKTPQPFMISLFLPGQDHKRSIELLEAQNQDLDIHNWKILNSKENGDGQVLLIGIDEKSAKTIQRSGHFLHYRFGKVNVVGLEKNIEDLMKK